MASTYLSRTQTNGSRRKFTLSAWVKRSKISSGDQVICGFNTSPDYNIEIKFQSGDTFNFYNYNNASSTTTFVTNRKFRDTSGWYHMVVAVDTEQATEANRVKIYVNGVQETSFSTATYPSLDLDLEINTSGKTNSIGAFPTGHSFFDGSMSFINFIDGTQYAASDFGSTDSTTGQWQINTSPSVTYGTNGFFILKNGNSVTDQSGQSNNFTVTGGTLTDYKDCPDNVFTTLNVLERLGSSVTVSNGNTQFFNQASDWRTIISNLAFPNTGKFYAEMQVNEVSSAVQVGIMAQLSFISQHQADLGTQGQYNSYAYLNTGQKRTNSSTTSYGNSFSSGILGIAVDMDNKNIYFAKDGTWQNSGDPTSGATGTGAAFTDLQNNKNYCFAVASQGSNPKVSWNFGNGYFATTAVTTNSGNGYAGAEGASKFNYTVPTGYSALNTKGLNE